MSTIAQVMYFTDDGDGEDMCMLYSGTHGNVILMASTVISGPFESVGHGPFFGICGFLDFAQSLAMDTALLPLTIGQTIFEASRPAAGSEEPAFERGRAP